MTFHESSYKSSTGFRAPQQVHLWDHALPTAAHSRRLAQRNPPSPYWFYCKGQEPPFICPLRAHRLVLLVGGPLLCTLSGGPCPYLIQLPLPCSIALALLDCPCLTCVPRCIAPLLPHYDASLCCPTVMPLPLLEYSGYIQFANRILPWQYSGRHDLWISDISSKTSRYWWQIQI